MPTFLKTGYTGTCYTIYFYVFKIFIIDLNFFNLQRHLLKVLGALFPNTLVQKILNETKKSILLKYPT